MKILFVCTGNTCRSPMAEAILRAKSSFEVRSAGTFAVTGAPANPSAIQTLSENEIAYSGLAQPVTDELVEWADLILTMTTQHKDAVISLFSASLNKTYTLKEYSDDKNAPETFDIADPYGQNQSAYQRAYKEIDQAIEQLIEKLPE